MGGSKAGTGRAANSPCVYLSPPCVQVAHRVGRWRWYHPAFPYIQ